MNAEYINPFLLSTVSVFEQMLKLPLERQAPYIRKTFDAMYDVTGIIGLSGKATGTVAFSLPRETALAITGILLGEPQTQLNPHAVDAIGEVTNMIAGAAKARMAELELSLGLPTVLIGRGTCIVFPSRATPISIPFKSPIGDLVVEVGIVKV
jgi:chemotaxis protein CheX